MSLADVLRELAQRGLSRFSVAAYDGPLGESWGYSVRHSGQRHDLSFIGIGSSERWAEFVMHAEYALREELEARNWLWRVGKNPDGAVALVWPADNGRVAPHCEYGPTPAHALAAVLLAALGPEQERR